MAKTNVEKMTDKLIKVFSDVTVPDYALELVAKQTYCTANRVVLGRILRYTKELQDCKKLYDSPLYDRRNYEQDSLW
jgi:hypothetical protein